MIKSYLKQILFYSSPALCPLLTHPVLTSFIHVKWHRIRRFLFLNLVFYFIFWSVLTGYILGYYGAITQLNQLPATNNVTQSTRVTQETGNHLEDSTIAESLKLYAIILLIILTLREILQLIISPFRYLTSAENWLEITLIVVTISILFCPSCTNVRHQISAVAILLSWAELILLIGRHPGLSTNIEMFKTVSWNFMKFLAWYSILIIAFALCFYTLFSDPRNSNENVFLNPAMSLLKTVVMLTGEFDTGPIPFVTHPGVSHIVFVIFVFLIAIVLFNLLNGLAVNDTQAIRTNAELLGYISQIKMISYFETMAMGNSTPFKGIITKLQTLCCFVPSVDCNSTQFACLHMFSKKISLFSDTYYCNVRVLPNQQNRIVDCNSYRRYQELISDNYKNACIERLKYIHMDASIMRTAKNVLIKKAHNEDLKKTTDEALQKSHKAKMARKEMLLEYGKELKEIKRENQKTQEILLEILSAVKKGSSQGLTSHAFSDDNQ